MMPSDADNSFHFLLISFVTLEISGTSTAQCLARLPSHACPSRCNMATSLHNGLGLTSERPVKLHSLLCCLCSLLSILDIFFSDHGYYSIGTRCARSSCGAMAKTEQWSGFTYIMKHSAHNDHAHESLGLESLTLYRHAFLRHAKKQQHT